ncbi:hypothetical protein DFH06DRAFT_560411 [Mycena polygramma]|nr:hypothetical protein DFH06DRAFT_560411 [Mycena polygramma]
MHRARNACAARMTCTALPARIRSIYGYMSAPPPESRCRRPERIRASCIGHGADPHGPADALAGSCVHRLVSHPGLPFSIAHQDQFLLYSFGAGISLRRELRIQRMLSLIHLPVLLVLFPRAPAFGIWHPRAVGVDADGCLKGVNQYSSTASRLIAENIPPTLRSTLSGCAHIPRKRPRRKTTRNPRSAWRYVSFFLLSHP